MSKIRKSAVTITHKDHRIPVIYMIRNIINNKVYIGQTVNLYERYKKHQRSSELIDRYKRPIISAFKKYGFDNFEFIILEHVQKDKNILTEREQFWMDKFQSYKKCNGYNACPAANSPLGYKHSEETKKKVSAASSKRKMSPEARKKMSEWHTGKKLSDETKKKISEYRKGVKNPNKKGKSVGQYDKETNNLISEFISISKASLSSGVGIGNIAETCKGKRKTAGGFVWRYL